MSDRDDYFSRRPALDLDALARLLCDVARQHGARLTYRLEALPAPGPKDAPRPAATDEAHRLHAEVARLTVAFADAQAARLADGRELARLRGEKAERAARFPSAAQALRLLEMFVGKADDPTARSVGFGLLEAARRELGVACAAPAPDAVPHDPMDDPRDRDGVRLRRSYAEEKAYRQLVRDRSRLNASGAQELDRLGRLLPWEPSDGPLDAAFGRWPGDEDDAALGSGLQGSVKVADDSC